MQRCFPFGSAISHEAARFRGWLGDTIGIGTLAEEYLEHAVVRQPVGGAERGMKWRLSGIRQWLVHVSALLNEKLAQSPVSVESRSIEVEIVAQRLD